MPDSRRTDEELKALLELEAKASPTLWARLGLKIFAAGGCVAIIPTPKTEGVFSCDANAEFIPAARNSLRSIILDLQVSRERERERESNPDGLCPPHLNIAAKLKDISEPRYGCPQCAVNHVAELEELITEMWDHLSGLGKIRFNDTEAARIVERAHMEEIQPAIDLLARAEAKEKQS